MESTIDEFLKVLGTDAQELVAYAIDDPDAISGFLLQRRVGIVEEMRATFRISGKIAWVDQIYSKVSFNGEDPATNPFAFSDNNSLIDPDTLLKTTRELRAYFVRVFRHDCKESQDDIRKCISYCAILIRDSYRSNTTFSWDLYSVDTSSDPAHSNLFASAEGSSLEELIKHLL